MLSRSKKLEVELDKHNVGYLPVRGDTLRTSIVETVTKHINEAFFVARDLPSDHPEVLADRRFRSANRWPTGLPGFREAIVAYCETMEQLVRKLVRLLKPVPQRTQPSRRRGVLKAENESVSTPQKAQNLQ
jgi:isopenicillin N synthase-like dioxygenase